MKLEVLQSFMTTDANKANVKCDVSKDSSMSPWQAECSNSDGTQANNDAS